MKCKICGKLTKENTDGDSKYCQGHDFWEVKRKKKAKKNNRHATPEQYLTPEQDIEANEPEWLIDNPDGVWTW